MTDNKIGLSHLTRKAFLYIRQSTIRQIYENAESTKRQYALKDKLTAMGWDESKIIVIDSDLGQSGADAEERHGFQHLVSEVSLGRAGIIAGIEVSRLSRSSSDWGRLLQISALADTLIMDEDGVYNVNDFNDRLLLGLKGTLSEAELHYLKARMRGGLLNKAKRGELMRPLSIGYIYSDYGQIVKDPDAQVQEAIAVFFNTFKRLGSAHGIVGEFKKQGLLFPFRRHKGFKLGELTWRPLANGRAVNIIQNPLYAGIFAYGRTQVHHTLEGRKVKAMQKSDCHSWLPNSHPAYISEAEYEENTRILSANMPRRKNSENMGAVREGSALLQGILICGVCGRKMTHRYSKTKYIQQPIYQCVYENQSRYGNICQRIPGGNMDRTIGDLILSVIDPVTMEAAVAVQREMIERKEEILRLYSQQVERTRYEMDLAKRRYLNVDPENRLVAAELEKEWNVKMREHDLAISAYDEKCATEIREVDDKLKIILAQLVEDFPKIWNDPDTPAKEKKRIVRLILDDITVTAKNGTVTLGVRFKGGDTKILEIPDVSKSLKIIQQEKDAVAEIDSLISTGIGNQQIADILNEKGFRTETHAKPFSHTTIAWLIKKHNITRRTNRNDATGWLTAKQKMAEIGVGQHKLRRMRLNNEIVWQTCNINGLAYLYKPIESNSESIRDT